MGFGILFALLLAATVSQARLWPWPEDFEEIQGRQLGDRFITEEEGDSLGKQDLCFDCHDGSVLDNRELWDPGLHGHRVGFEPGSALPDGVPLVEGRLYCGSCHLPHGGMPGSVQDSRKPYLRYPNTNDVFCVACHQERATPGPQESSRNHSFLKKARQDTATADPQAWKRIQELGGKVGKEGATRCQSCHRPHGAPSRSALILAVDRSQMCSICHHDIADGTATVSHPLHGENAWKVEGRPKTVECLTCHRVHEAPVPGVLLAEEGEGFCLRCHEKARLPTNDLHRQKKLEDFLRQSPYRIGSGFCGGCHQVHRAKGAFLARFAEDLAVSDPDSRFCAGCHASSKGWAETRIGPFFHSLGPWSDTNSSLAVRPATGLLPLLTPDGRIPDRGKGKTGTVLGCRTCHFMHDRPDQAAAGATAANLREPLAGGRLCLHCHPDREAIRESRHNPLRSEEPGVRQRIPVMDDNLCSVCHVVHQARTPWLYPSPASVVADLDAYSAGCLDCHGPDSPKAASGVGRFYHPLGPVAGSRGEQSRQGLAVPEALPLVSRPAAAKAGDSRESPGSLSCITCHGLHLVSDEGKGLRKCLRPPLNIEHACLVCHQAQRMLSRTRHFFRGSSFDQEIGLLFGAVEEKHECTPCHLVHRARGPGMWFVDLPAPRNTFEQDERSRRCLVCHLHDSLKSIREENGHPIGKPMTAEYLPSPQARLKLGRIGHDETGLREAVVCATCHLNHGVENPDGAITLFAGGGLPEGELCIACHGRNKGIVGSPHDFRTRPEGRFRPDGGRSFQFGVCAGCHANHDAPISRSLIAFAVAPPKGQGNPGDMFCLHCHLDPRVMGDRRVKFYVHPSGQEVQQRFKEKGPLPQQWLGEPSRTSLPGYEAIFRVRCRTCHDNHQWTEAPSEESGDVTATELTSFLKGSEVAETLCVNCHGEEALYRYRFFHDDRAFRLRIPDE